MTLTKSIWMLLLAGPFVLYSTVAQSSAQPATQPAQSVAQPTPNAIAPKSPLQTGGPALDMGEDPGPLYTRLVKEWMDTTHFAKNTAELAVGKLQIDMQNDPQLQKIVSKNLIADLQQFYYEILIAPETVQAMARVYAQYFTLDEMQELIVFYRTPIGQKWVKANADISLKTQRIAIELLKKNEKGYVKIIAKYTTPVKERR